MFVMRKYNKIFHENQVVKLDDKSKTGRRRDWSKYKKQSLAVSAVYKSFEGLAEYSRKMSECGGWLKFSACPEGHEKWLLIAVFCHLRLCCMCQWRRSLVIYHQVNMLAHEHLKRFSSDIPIFLTLTVPNVAADELEERLQVMQKSWHRLMKRRNVKRISRSWFRGLEVTYNVEKNSYHPHYHVLLYVPMNYFAKKYNLYISRDKWLEMWRESTGIPETTQVDVRRVKRKRKDSPMAAVSAEVAKYATKPSDYIFDTKEGLCEANAEVVKALHFALRRKRLVAFGGEFAKIRKEKRMEDIEQSDEIHVEGVPKDCKCLVCKSDLIDELYSWHLGLKAYIRQTEKCDHADH